MKINTNNTLKGKRTLLATLDSPFLDDQYVFPYLGVLYLVAVGQRVGADVCYTNNLRSADVWRYDVIGISCQTPQSAQAYAICRWIKEWYPHITVMIGGPHATHYLDECKKQPFDIIVCGDGERVFERLLTGDIPQQRIYHDELTEAEMDTYPIPYRGNIDRYNYQLNGLQTTTLVNSRGCPMQCRFCESAGTKARWYSVEHFEEEIKDIANRGIRAVMIFDDLFAISYDKVKPYLEVLKRYCMTFRCFGHANTMTPKLAALLAASGCVEIGFGAESAAQEILNKVDKKTTVKRMRDFVETVIGAGMRVKAFFMIGLPGETEETFRKTYDFISQYRRNCPDTFDFDCTVFFPYKGTRIGDAARNGGGYDIRPRKGLDWSKIDSNGYGAFKKKQGAADIVIETQGLSADRIGELQRSTLLCRR